MSLINLYEAGPKFKQLNIKTLDPEVSVAWDDFSQKNNLTAASFVSDGENIFANTKGSGWFQWNGQSWNKLNKKPPSPKINKMIKALKLYGAWDIFDSPPYRNIDFSQESVDKVFIIFQNELGLKKMLSYSFFYSPEHWDWASSPNPSRLENTIYVGSYDEEYLIAKSNEAKQLVSKITDFIGPDNDQAFIIDNAEAQGISGADIKVGWTIRDILDDAFSDQDWIEFWSFFGVKVRGAR